MRGCCTAIHRCAYGRGRKSRAIFRSRIHWIIGLLFHLVPRQGLCTQLMLADAVTIQQYSEAEGSPAVSANAFRCLDESLQGHCLPGSY